MNFGYLKVAKVSCKVAQLLSSAKKTHAWAQASYQQPHHPTNVSGGVYLGLGQAPCHPLDP